MVRVELVRRIDRPIDDVFERLVDIDGYPEWLPQGRLFVTCFQVTDGPVDIGTEYVDRTRLGPVRGEVVELERPTRVVFRYTARLFGRTAMEGYPGYTLVSAGTGGTEVRHVAEGRLRGPFRLLQPLVQKVARGERRRTVDALKASFESPGG